MTAVLHAWFLALRDLSRPAVRHVLIQSICLTLLLLFLVGGGIIWAARAAAGHYNLLSGDSLSMATALLIVALAAASWVLFRGVAIFIIGLFADSIIEDVEAQHYPAAAALTSPVGFRRSLQLSLRSAGRFLGANALALPIYILLIPTAVGVPLLALFLNAWLLGFDLEAMVRARHISRPALPRPARWGLGLLSAASLSIPIVNFLAPVLSAAMAVHLFHLSRKGSA